ncbi:GAF domain-containing protein, partial [Bacteroidota bacterium]
VTEKKDRKARSVVIEDYSTSKHESGKETRDKIKEHTKEIIDEEGFRVILVPGEIPDDAIEMPREVLNEIEEKEDKEKDRNENKDLSFDENQANFEFDEEFSGVKVISKKKFSAEINVDKDSALKTKSDEKETPAEEKIEIKTQDTGQDSGKYKGKKIDIPLSELMETDPAFGLEPRKEFEYFLIRVLKVIRAVTSTKSTVFMLVNSERRELIVEAFDSEVPGKIAVRKRIPFGNDIVSQIVANMKPEILTEINPNAELDLIPYYLQPVGTSSFFGMPVYFNNAIVGILCVDSDEINAYDTSIVGLFGQIAKLIGGLVKSYTGKYDLMQDSRTLEAVNQFRSMMADSELTLEKLYDSVLNAASSMFDNAVIGIIGIDQDKNDWSVMSVKNNSDPDDIKAGTQFSKSSLVAGTVFDNKVVVNAPNITGQVRISEQEVKLDTGYFISVPLKSFSTNYGALFVEGVNSADISSYDVSILETLASHAGSTIEQIYFSEMLQKSRLFDPSTGLLNTPAFMQRLNQEVLRSIDFGYPLTLCLVQIDKYKSFDPEQHIGRSEIVLTHVVDIIQNKLRAYDLFGRADANVFGLVLIDIGIKEARIWAEKLRSDIAISVLKIQSDSFTVTVSIGLAQLGKDEAIDDILTNAKEMLHLSSLKTNTVTMFE